ncbi:MAG: gluconate 2-dehydrogenase subunit 3 family protein [Bacteroidetes bacterium]|nr:MAG: gluconate 2-dehydrogenase subunit 3 family protein [Bacteroidota bacterium]
MKRRDSLKYLAAGSVGAGLLLTNCGPDEKAATTPPADEHAQHNHSHGGQEYQLSPEDQKLMAEQFFNEHEMKTIRVLGDLIIPADEQSGSASDAGVPEFIEFMAKDQPKLQTPLRGGLRWLDAQSIRRYEKAFVDAAPEQQTAILDEIAWPKIAKPEMSQGVRFFNQFRDLVATGFFTSKIGIADLKYDGNRPNQWDGAPKEWLDRLGVSYDEA